jgi:hypothetical protein
LRVKRKVEINKTTENDKRESSKEFVKFSFFSFTLSALSRSRLSQLSNKQQQKSIEKSTHEVEWNVGMITIEKSLQRNFSIRLRESLVNEIMMNEISMLINLFYQHFFTFNYPTNEPSMSHLIPHHWEFKKDKQLIILQV